VDIPLACHRHGTWYCGIQSILDTDPAYGTPSQFSRPGGIIQWKVQREVWIQLIVRDQTIPDKHAEILLKLSEVKSIVSSFERNQFEFAELCLSDNKYYIDQATVNEIKKTIEETSPIEQFSVGRYRTMKA